MSEKVKSELRQRLEWCVEEQSPILIKYHGGSQPGSKRWILPLTIAGARLRARDVMSDKAKMFSVSKIEIVEDQSALPDYVEKADKKLTLLEAITDHLGELESSVGARF
jgi:hypothetical protein